MLRHSHLNKHGFQPWFANGARVWPQYAKPFPVATNPKGRRAAFFETLTGFAYPKIPGGCFDVARFDEAESSLSQAQNLLKWSQNLWIRTNKYIDIDVYIYIYIPYEDTCIPIHAGCCPCTFKALSLSTTTAGTTLHVRHRFITSSKQVYSCSGGRVAGVHWNGCAYHVPACGHCAGCARERVR